MPEAIVIRLDMYMMPPKVISTAYFRNRSHRQYQTIVSQIFEVIPLMLLEFMNRSSRNLVRMCHAS
jgi:hypothetical protein